MKEYMQIMNPVAAFIEETLSEETGRLERGELYRRYVEWCKDAGHESQSRTKFIQNFRKTIKQIKPEVKEKIIMGVRCFEFGKFRPMSDFYDEEKDAI